MWLRWSALLRKEFTMGDIQSCPIKLPPLFHAPAVWVVPVLLIHRLRVMPFICDSYRNSTTKLLSIHFFYLFLLLLISLETTTPHARRVLLYSRFYKHNSYSCPINWWPGCIYDLPLYETLYIIDLQCTFSVGVMVALLIQISTRSAKINKTIGADIG